jgi:hypothetical protein
MEKLVSSMVAKTYARGRPGREYWLNEDQVVVLGFLSEAPDAVIFQKRVIAVWKASPACYGIDELIRERKSDLEFGERLTMCRRLPSPPVLVVDCPDESVGRAP